MKKTPHQEFVDKLRKTLIKQDKKPTNVSNSGNKGSAKNRQYSDELQKEIEDKFKELFGDVDDNDDDWEA